MKIHIKVKSSWGFWLLTFLILFIVALPFTFFGMALVSYSPFWMWQSIFMFFAGLLMVKKN